MTRVGVIGPQDADSFADNIADCLPDLGVEAVPLGMPRREFKDRRVRAAQDFIGRALPNLDDKWQRRVGQRAIDEGCDLVISIWGELMPGAVRMMRDADIPVALWFPDAVSNLGRQIMFVAPYSRLYFKDPVVVERITNMLALPAAYLPEACNPHWHRSTADPGADGDLVMAGNVYATRATLLTRLVEDRVPLRLYGNSPARWYGDEPWKPAWQGRSIVRQEKADVFRRASGVLNNLHPSELGSVNCRLFEAAGSGAAVLCEDRQAVADLFEPGAEVLTFSTYDELVKHARALLDDPDLTRRIGDAAAARAHAEHTYQHRLQRVLEECL